MYGTLKQLVQNQREAEKSPFKMEFNPEPQSQCGTKFQWLRLVQNQGETKKNAFKMELNRDLNVELTFRDWHQKPQG